MRFQTKRALTVANTLAVDAQVRDALEQADTTQLRSRINETVKPVQASSGADFITIADRHLIRQWHVNPERIGLSRCLQSLRDRSGSGLKKRLKP